MGDGLRIRLDVVIVSLGAILVESTAIAVELNTG